MDQIPVAGKEFHNTHGIVCSYDISFKGICPKCEEGKGGTAWIGKAMYKLSYGLFILTAKAKEITDASCTAIQAASEPNQLSITNINKANYTHDMIQRPENLDVISVFESQKAQFRLFKHFGFNQGRDTNKFETF